MGKFFAQIDQFFIISCQVLNDIYRTIFSLLFVFALYSWYMICFYKAVEATFTDGYVLKNILKPISEMAKFITFECG